MEENATLWSLGVVQTKTGYVKLTTSCGESQKRCFLSSMVSVEGFKEDLRVCEWQVLVLILSVYRQHMGSFQYKLNTCFGMKKLIHQKEV